MRRTSSRMTTANIQIAVRSLNGGITVNIFKNKNKNKRAAEAGEVGKKGTQALSIESEFSESTREVDTRIKF